MHSVVLHDTLVNEIGMQLEVIAAPPLLNTGVTIACAHSLGMPLTYIKTEYIIARGSANDDSSCLKRNDEKFVSVSQGGEMALPMRVATKKKYTKRKRERERERERER